MYIYRANAVNLSAQPWCVIGPTTSKNKHPMLKCCGRIHPFKMSDHCTCAQTGKCVCCDTCPPDGNCSCGDKCKCAKASCNCTCKGKVKCCCTKEKCCCGKGCHGPDTCKCPADCCCKKEHDACSKAGH
uniref:Metallothionein n=1 Tax=Magallana gigas TaxID=29159 RepID=K1RE29_MAGGI